MNKNIIISFIKLGFLVGIFYWLISSGKLKVSDLTMYGKNIQLLLGLLCTWLFGFVFIGAWRWQIICKSLNISKDYLRMVSLHMIGTFFNVAMPGAVGGDFVKAYYLYKEDKEVTKTNAFLTVFLDRLSGLLGLFILGFSSFLILSDDPFANKDILPMILFVSIFFIGSISVVGIFFFGGEKLIEYFQNKFAFLQKISFLDQLKIAAIALNKSPLSFVNALLLSAILQGANMLFFFYICTLFVSEVTFAQIALVFPLGVLISAIPLAPGGLGVGHVAFEKLFTMVGIGSGIGANVFNLHCVGFITCFCVGGIPYLLNRKQIQKDLEKNAVSS